MSNVTDVLILTLGDGEAMAALTERRQVAAWTGYFGDLSHTPAAEFWGHDGKWPECWVWAGAFNRLNRPALLQELQELAWQRPDCVQVLIRGQDDDCWGMWMFVDGRLVEVELPGATRLPAKAGTVAEGRSIDVEVGTLIRRPPPTSTSVPCNADVYFARGAWRFVIYADELTTAVAGTLPVAGDAPVESARAAAVAALRERFGAEYDIVWRFEPNDDVWWGDIATATA